MDNFKNIERTDVFFSILWNKICFKQVFISKSCNLYTSSSLGLSLSGGLNSTKPEYFYEICLFCYTHKFHKTRTFTNVFKVISSLNALTLFNKKGFFVELDTIGLGFRLERVTDNIFYLRLGYSSGIYFFIPLGVKVAISVINKKLFFFGVDVNKINNVVSTLFLLRKSNPYRVMGFTKPGKIIRLRTGKQR